MSLKMDTAAPAGDRVGLSWLITVRWTTVLAGGAALAAGRGLVLNSGPAVSGVVLLAACAVSNGWLTWRARRDATGLTSIAGVLICGDVVVLSWLLLQSGGVLNPASVFYLVEIVVAALVLGRVWTLIVTALSVGGYATLFVAPTAQLEAAQVMHPEIGLHMRGMWLAFALTALIVAVLVTRLAIAVERRDRALEALRDRAGRTARAAGLATLAAGAAHELSTPLATMAVAARELERRMDGVDNEELRQDARLIRAEIDRCRRILEAMAAQAGESPGESPRPIAVGEIVQAVRTRLAARDRERLTIDVPAITVVWPIEAMARAVGNLVQNALQASEGVVSVTVRAAGDRVIHLSIADQGAGMSADQLTRAGEPFFTTKPPGAGTGLGLFVTRSSVEQLGGTLTLVSQPGRGTTATIALPFDVLAVRAGSTHG